MIFRDSTPNVRQALVSRLSGNSKYELLNVLRSVDSRLFYIVDGCGEMEIEGTKYSLSPGTAILFRAGTEYVWRVEKLAFYSVNFDYSMQYSHIKETFHPIHSDKFRDELLLDCGRITDESLLNSPIVLPFASSIESLVRSLAVEYRLGGKHMEEYLSACLKSAIYGILRLCEESNAGKEEVKVIVRNLIEYIQSNIGGDLSNNTLAELFHFNPTYLGRIFKQHTGVPLHEFILNIRLGTAAEKLRSELTPINEIAKAVGFSNPQHFAQTFTGKMGICPRDYRKK